MGGSEVSTSVVKWS